MTMTPEEKELLERTLKLSEENNDLLKKMRRSVILGRIVKVIYWIVIIAVTMGAYYFVQPYIDVVMKGYTNIMSGFDTIKNAGDSVNSIPNDFGGIIDSLKGTGN